MVNEPFVTCIMPTRDRRRFVGHAIECFLQQDYPALELLVADDGIDAVEDLLPADPRIRYLRLDPIARIGTKRNAACAAARGDVIVHWDDDDWSAPWRVSYQMESLATSGADICGLNRLLFYQPSAARAWEYVYPGTARPWVHGATLAYRTAFWRRNPFPDIHVGEDTRFVWSPQAPRVQPLDRHEFFVGTIHGGNTSAKHTGDGRWQPAPNSVVERTLGVGWDRYRQAMGVPV
jgi:glycosyltransferase involved in cell wall biosynthesis